MVNMDIMFAEVPNPGTKEAQELGCTCPVMDNSFGKGAYKDKDGKMLFWYDSNCPLHKNLLFNENKER